MSNMHTLQNRGLPSIKPLACLPAAAILLVGVLFPLCIVVYVSFCMPLDFGGVAWGKITPVAYLNVVLEHDFDGSWIYRTAYISIFIRSFSFAALTTVLCLVTGLPTALFIATQRAARRSILLLLVAAPFVVSLVVRAYGWVILLADGGAVNRMTGMSLLYTDVATMIGLVSIFFPFMVLPIYVSLREFDWEVAEAASSLGATPWQVLKRIVVPACMPGVGAGVALIFVPALGSYVVPDLLGGAKAMMIGNLVQLAFTSDRNWPLGAALSVALLCAVVAVSWIARRRPLDVVRGRGGREPAAVFPGTTWIAIPMFVFLYLPLAALAATSFYAGSSSLVWQGFGLHGYVEALTDDNLLRAALGSLALASATVAVVTVISVATAVTLDRGSHAMPSMLETAMQIPLVVPEIVLAIATLLAFSSLSIDLNFASVLFAHVVFCLPVAYIPIRASVKKVDQDLLDAAATLSATPWTTFWTVTLPLIWPGVVTGVILSFVTSLDDFVTTYFVAGAGVITLPTYIYGALKVGLPACGASPLDARSFYSVLGTSRKRSIPVSRLIRRAGGGNAMWRAANPHVIGTLDRYLDPIHAYRRTSMATYDELKTQLEQLTREADTVKQREIEVALARIREAVAKYGIGPDQIFPNWVVRGGEVNCRGVPMPKYRNPATGQTWVGRGRAPNWMAGRPREAFLVGGAGSEVE
ncbi:ABC transporter permease subunit (plasmid) [Burkholderia sp. FERM BP-3421]|uniref:ABC transporter permease subunit n=1 Tax=Burkholderia sp. FERM BP-3421 TaxID=1494466 RepID=UPI002361FA15|nr:ABC transporter permease subunit [Burkholderia sp. FERM BP-3421]WDD90258.1 ABC transporter permease subunit [Burkholderia sp. FERM BP-3421]